MNFLYEMGYLAANDNIGPGKILARTETERGRRGNVVMMWGCQVDIIGNL